MPSPAAGGFVEQAGQRFGRGAHPQERQVGAQPLVVRTGAHAGTSSTGDVGGAGEGEADDLGQLVQIDGRFDAG